MTASTETENPYLAEIRGWDWSGIKADALSELEPAEDGDGLEGRCFLGTIFALYPSGKYYTPWACSNVEACERCSGKGEVPNPASDPEHCQAVDDYAQELWIMMRDAYGTFPQAPERDQKHLQKVRAERDSVKLNITCPDCAGIGSREAYRDQLYSEALEQVADEHGMWVGSGEGDPCDVLAGVSMDDPECPKCSHSMDYQGDHWRCPDCYEKLAVSDIIECSRCKNTGPIGELSCAECGDCGIIDAYGFHETGCPRLPDSWRWELATIGDDRVVKGTCEDAAVVYYFDGERITWDALHDVTAEEHIPELPSGPIGNLANPTAEEYLMEDDDE